MISLKCFVFALAVPRASPALEVALVLVQGLVQFSAVMLAIKMAESAYRLSTEVVQLCSVYRLRLTSPDCENALPGPSSELDSSSTIRALLKRSILICVS
jgi:anaerobic glycerol-3-phosphate dehydrogenase